jgi:hypothetical protein
MCFLGASDGEGIGAQIEVFWDGFLYEMQVIIGWSKDSENLIFWHPPSGYFLQIQKSL